MIFIKGFFATLAFILLQLAIVGVGFIAGVLLFDSTGNLLWFFASIGAAFIVAWAMFGGFVSGAVRKAVRHDG